MSFICKEKIGLNGNNNKEGSAWCKSDKTEEGQCKKDRLVDGKHWVTESYDNY